MDHAYLNLVARVLLRFKRAGLAAALVFLALSLVPSAGVRAQVYTDDVPLEPGTYFAGRPRPQGTALRSSRAPAARWRRPRAQRCRPGRMRGPVLLVPGCE